MQLKTSHLLIVAAVFLVGPKLITPPDEATQARNQAAAEAGDTLSDSRQQAIQVKRRSRLALQRVQAACVKVYDLETGYEAVFTEGARVYATDDPSGERVMSDGTIVCNSLGHTASVQDGKMTDIAMASPEDAVKYQEFFDQQLGGK